MTGVDLAALRALAEKCKRRGYPTVMLKPSDALALVEAVVAAQAFVATTSAFRQTHDSRPEFADLAVALAPFRQEQPNG